MGCQLALGPSERTPDPEKTIIQCLEFFWLDKKFFTLLLGLVKYRLTPLVNEKRLIDLGQKLDSNRRALLFVLMHKAHAHNNNPRARRIARAIWKKGLTLSTIPENYQNDFYISRKGVDKDFLRVKAKVAGFFDDQPEKKFQTSGQLYHSNPWLRLRALIGTDHRSDVLFLKASESQLSQREIVDRLGCHKSSVSRILASIKDFGDLSHFILSTWPEQPPGPGSEPQ